MKNVMIRAWEIAREGKVKFGGNVAEYFAQALKIAWHIAKKSMNESTSRVKGTIKKFHLPELTGSEKQIDWAKKIRKQAMNVLALEVSLEDWKEGQPKRDIPLIIKALSSEEGIKEKLNNTPEIKKESVIKSMNNALDRYNRFVEIGANTDSKFWIDNRDNQNKNYMFKLFKEYVSTGVKKF